MEINWLLVYSCLTVSILWICLNSFLEVQLTFIESHILKVYSLLNFVYVHTCETIITIKIVNISTHTSKGLCTLEITPLPIIFFPKPRISLLFLQFSESTSVQLILVGYTHEVLVLGLLCLFKLVVRIFF